MYRVLLAVLTFCCGVFLTGCTRTSSALQREAAEAFARSEWPAARLAYRKIIEGHPTDADARYRLGIAFVRTGQPDQAYEQFRAAIAISSDRTDVLEALSELLLESYWRDVRKPAAVRDELLRHVKVLEARDPRSYIAQRVFGYIAVADGRPDEAIPRFKAALERKPGDSDSVAMLAQLLSDTGAGGDAEQLLSSHIDKHPRDEFVVEVLLRHYEKHNRTSDVEALLRRGMRFDSASPLPYTRMARYFIARGDSNRSERLISELAQQSSVVTRHYAIAEFWESVGRPIEALRAYDAAAAAEPARSVDCRRRQVMLLVAQRRLKEAAELAEQTLRAAPDDPTLLRAKALALSSDTTTLPQAIALLRKLTDRTPADGLALLDLGRLLNRTGDLDGARHALDRAMKASGVDRRLVLLALASNATARNAPEEALRHADAILEFDPANVQARLVRIPSLASVGRLQHARAALSEITAEIGTSAATDLEMGFLLIREGKPEQAESILRRLFKPGLDNARVAAGLAEALTAQRRYDEAVRLLKADLAAAPRRGIILYALAESLGRKGEVAEAAAVYNNLLRDRADPKLYERLATLWISARQMREAVDVLTEGRRRFPSDALLAGTLAQVMDMSGDVESARALYREWMALDRSNPVPYNNLAFLITQHGPGGDDAIQLANEAVRRDPSNPSFRETLAIAYLKEGRSHEAAHILQSLVQSDPRNPGYRYYYGRGLQQLGKVEQARAEWNHALRFGATGAVRRNLEAALTAR